MAEEFYEVMDQSALPDTSENRVESARLLNQVKLELDRQNMSPLDPEFSDVMSALRSQLTDSDFNELIDYKPNLDVEAFGTPHYRHYEKEVRAFVDLITSMLPAELKDNQALNQLLDLDDQALPGGSKLGRAIMAEVRASFRAGEDTFPSELGKQQDAVREVFTAAVLDVLTDTTFVAGTDDTRRLIDVLVGNDAEIAKLQDNAVYQMFVEENPALQRIQQNREAFEADMAEGIDQLMAD